MAPVFVVLFTNPQAATVEIVHQSLAKVLQTNNSLKMTWVYTCEKLKQDILRDSRSRSLEKFITCVSPTEVNRLNYAALVCGRGKGKGPAKNLYWEIVLGCLRKGRLLMTLPDPELEKILIDGETCVLLPELNSRQLGHIFHFFISFKEERLKIGRAAKRYYQTTLPSKKMSPPLRKILNRQISHLRTTRAIARGN